MYNTKLYAEEDHGMREWIGFTGPHMSAKGYITLQDRSQDQLR